MTADEKGHSSITGMHGRQGQIYGPDGNLLTLNTLPSAQTVRWVVRRKFEVVAAVRGGLLSLQAACERYGISVEEFLDWNIAVDRFGPAGLKATRRRDHLPDRGPRRRRS